MKYQIVCTVMKTIEIPDAELGGDLLAEQATKREAAEEEKVVKELSDQGWGVDVESFEPEGDEDDEDDEDSDDDDEDEDEDED